MADNSGTSTSIYNTPQADDDTHDLRDQDLSDFDTDSDERNGIFLIDVMANDSGGKSKTLYSLDDGLDDDGQLAAEESVDELLDQDSVFTVDYELVEAPDGGSSALNPESVKPMPTLSLSSSVSNF